MSVTVFNPVTTEAGKAAAINANATGVQVAITAVSFGTAFYEPTGYETALGNEVKRVPILAGSMVTTNQARITAVWESETDYSPIAEVGFWAGDVLFSVWSRSNNVPLGYKTPGADFVLINDLKFVGIPASSITIQVDSSGVSSAIVMLSNHEASPNPHPVYALKSKFPDVQAFLGCTTGGTANVITLTPASGVSVTAYSKFQKFSFVAATGNTGAVTVNVAGVGAVPIKKNGTVDLAQGDIKAGAVYELIHDGTNFQIAGGMGGSGGGAIRTFEYIATEDQQTFTGADKDGAILSYTNGAVVVYRNGVKVSDFTATDGVAVSLSTTAAEGEEIAVVAYTTSTFADSVKRSGDSMEGPLVLYPGSTAPTPAANDASLKLANMAAVRRERGSYSGLITIAANTSIPATALGNIAIVSGNTADVVASLPAIDPAMPDGACIEVQNISTYKATVAKSGADTIVVQGNPITSVVVNPGEHAVFVKNSARWVAHGSAADRLSGPNAALVAMNGYQTMPSGVIMQWLTVNTNASNTPGNPQIVALPIPFPNAIFYAGGSEDGAGAGAGAEVCVLDWSTAGKTTKAQLGVYSNYVGVAKIFAIGS